MNPANHHARNRLHSRYPRSIIKRQQLAYDNYQFAIVMRKLGFDHWSLRQIEQTAQRVMSEVNP